MKKVFCLLLALMALGTCALAETVNATDEAVLNIFSWEGYIDYTTVLKPFEDETGIKVNYATFSSNEEMYEKLSARRCTKSSPRATAGITTSSWPATTCSMPLVRRA